MRFSACVYLTLSRTEPAKRRLSAILWGFQSLRRAERLSWEKNAGHRAELQNTVGYLPGEIALPNGITGTKFLDMIMKMRHVESSEYCSMLLDRFELNPRMETKEMSLGMKRKLAVVTAFCMTRIF